jgi:hypothetical protein
LGEFPYFIFFTAVYGLVIGYYVRQKASGQLVQNAFGDFCGCALIPKKADDAVLHIFQTKIQLKKKSL